MKLHEALSVQRGDIVAIVGGGGKTNTMLKLAGELAAMGLRVLSTTTTRLARREIGRSINQMALGGAQLPPDSLAEALEAHSHVFVYQRLTPDGKMQGLRVDWFDQHVAPSQWADVMLVEADGSRQLPFKGPYSHEPVIPATTTLVVPVAGMDVLGQPLDQEHVYGADMITATTGHPEGEPVTPGLIAEVLAHPWLGLKSVPQQARVIPLLNKVESKETFEAAGVIARRMLERRSIRRVMIGAVRHPQGPIWEVHRRVGAVVLAAGLSTRMGDMKVLLPWGNTTVLGQICRTLLDARLDTTVVIGHQAQAVTDALAGLPVNMVRNPDYATSEMLLSLKIGLAELEQRGMEACVVALGDQPTIQSDVLHLLLQAYREGRAGIVAPSYQMRRGHPIVIDRRYWREILDLPLDRAPRDIVDAHLDDIHLAVVETPSVVRDLDTPEDYERALRDFKAGKI